MQINFDSEYKQLRITGCELSRQYISRSPKLVFTVLYRQEYSQDFDKRAYHIRNRDGVYIGVGENDVYIGISDRNKNGILGRIKDHLRDSTKNSLKYFLIITSAETSDESYDTNVITSMEHVLHQMAVYTDRVNVINSGATHYVIKNDIFKIKDFLQAYGVIYDILRDRNIFHLLPIDMSLNVGDGDDIFKLEDNKVKLKVHPNKDITIFKNSKFPLPVNVMMDSTDLDTTFRQLLKDNYITILPPINNHAQVLVTRDILCSKQLRIDDLTDLFLNDEVRVYGKRWRNSNNKTLE